MIARLLLDLLLKVLTQISDAVFHHVFPLVDFLNAEFERLIQGVEVGATLNLAPVRIDDLVVDLVGALDG